jgi:hypothetical protein
VRQEGNEIMIFVGNRGCVQIFTGALEKLAPMRGWLNIFNTTFTLHLREESIDEVWVTRKPTSTDTSPASSCSPKTARRSPSSTASAAKATRAGAMAPAGGSSDPRRTARMMRWLLLFIAFPLLSHAAVERLVTLGGDVTEIVYALGAQQSLVARDSTSSWPPAAQKLPDVGYLRQLNAEGILALRPQLVLASAQAQPSLVLQRCRRAGEGG